MGADNWGKCPGCGAVESLREDYELGFFRDGNFHVDYSGVCQASNTGKGCGYRFNFQIVLDPEDKPYRH